MDKVAFLDSIRYEQTASVRSGDELDSATSEVSISNMDESIAEIPSTVNQDSRGIVGEASSLRVVGIPSAAVVSEPNPKRASSDISARAAGRSIHNVRSHIVEN
jgi:hypothetical protein